MRRKGRIAILAAIAAGIGLADINDQTITLQNGNAVNLDNGTVVSSAGDVLFTGTNLTFQGKASGYVLGVLGANGYNNILSLGFLQTGFANKTYNATPITGSSLVADEVFGVHTNGNNFAKVWIHAVSSASITIEFTTFGGTASGGGPAITSIVNNSSLTPAGLPNSGIAPSTLFIVQGTNLAAAGSTAVLQDSTQGLPTTLNQASLSVAAGGKTYTPAIYYSSPTQIAAVLPAAVPPGPATLTVSNGGALSSPFNFNVVPTAFGIDAYNGNTAVLTDASTGALITPISSGKPGQVVVLWGTGLGSNSVDSDTTYTSSPHAINTPATVYVGGVQAPAVAYSGGSVYPGVHVIGFTIPQGVPNGCYVPVVVVTGSGGNGVVSNSPVAAIMNNGGVCSDPQYGANGTQISALGAHNTISAGSIVVTHSTEPGTVGSPPTITDIAIATFQQANGASYGSTSLTLGTCTVNAQSAVNGNANAIGLDAGAVTVTPPSSGSPIAMPQVPTLPGLYSAYLPSGALNSGGTLTFQGSGGTNPPLIGRFTATLNFPPSINWINQSASGVVTRASGQTYTWGGAAPGSFVVMIGQSTSPSSGSSGGASSSYTCIAPASAGQFTVPPYILLGLPAGTGASRIQNVTPQTLFLATGLDYAFTLGVLEIGIAAVYQ